MKVLFLDDERYPKEVTWIRYPEDCEFVIARSFLEFCLLFNEYEFDIISFDHDLQCFLKGKEYTGMDCIKYICEEILIYNYELPQVVFHTQNPIGKQNMQSYWENFIKVKGENYEI